MWEGYVFECPFCHQKLTDRQPPCPHCGIFWNRQEGPRAVQVGKPGTHTNEHPAFATFVDGPWGRIHHHKSAGGQVPPAKHHE